MEIRYTRDDVTLTVRSFGSDQVLLRVEHDGVTYEQLLPATYVRDHTNWLFSWWTPAVDAVRHASGGEWALNRVVIRVEEPTWAEVDWEGALGAIEPKRSPLAVRTSPVVPRFANKPFDVPARVLEVGVPLTVENAIRETLNGSKAEFALTVGVVGAPSDMEDYVARAMWSTTDIIHLHDAEWLPLAQKFPGREDPVAAWLLRLTSRWQTRLIVFEGPASSLPQLRQTAQRIIDAGGPAVIIGTAINAVHLYGGLLHDRPFDWLLQGLTNAALFAGAGREEALRFSAIGRRLSEPRTEQVILDWARTSAWRMPTVDVPNFAQVVEDVVNTMSIPRAGEQIDLKGEREPRLIRFGDLLSNHLLDMGWATGPLDKPLLEMQRSVGPVTTTDLARTLSELATPIDPGTTTEKSAYYHLITSRLANLRELYPTFQFEEHESDGTLPIAAKATGLRKLLHAAGAGHVEGGPRRPRHVNSAFHRMLENGSLKRIPQDGARLTPEAVVHLGVSIGHKDPLTITIGDLVFSEEAIQWTEAMIGTWIEIAVTGIDFEVLANPVQEVWLPKDDDTDLVTFAVRPRVETTVPGVARLRFTIFHRNNVVQSFLVAALLTTFHGTADQSFARALSIEMEEIRDADVGYVSRLEYSVVDPDQGVAKLEPRELSIVANESAGQKVFSIKGTDFFSESVNANLQAHVKSARAALRKASLNDAKEYRFIDHNTGKELELLSLLWDMAEAGWAIYSAVLPGSERQKKASELLGLADGIIHAGHMDLREVIPWSLVYDRKLDPRMTEWYENPEDPKAPKYDVKRDICTAALPSAAADGTIPKLACEQDPQCILHPDRIAASKAAGGPIVCPESVICPRRFWGFAHQIEVPAQQVKSTSVPEGVRRVIKSTNPASVFVGFNPNVKLYNDHKEAILTAVTKSGKAQFRSPADMARTPILQMMNTQPANIIYLYCHAYLDTLSAPGTENPNLDFGLRGQNDLVFPRDLDGDEWAHTPLVFMNGCGTVGFSPSAPSEFVTKLIQGRQASAVIGTEVTVWEQLAAEVGCDFLRDFLDNKSAGEALLRARRRLLAKFNPLGLVYTLYGSANLQLEVTP